jgi:hypothetical protein
MNSRWSRLPTERSAQPAPPYVWCPYCREITPQVLAIRPPNSAHLVPVAMGCGPCGRVHDVTDEASIITEHDASEHHDPCGTEVSCPSTAHRVRCPNWSCKGTDRYFPGPALRTT